MKRLFAALIGSTIGAIISLITYAYYVTSTYQQSVSDGVIGVLLYILSPLVAGIIAGILAAWRSLHGGRKGAVAGLLAALFLAVIQFIVFIDMLVSIWPSGTSASSGNILSPYFGVDILTIFVFIFYLGEIALVPAFGAIAGTITSRLTYKPQMQEEAAAITTEDIPNND